MNSITVRLRPGLDDDLSEYLDGFKAERDRSRIMRVALREYIVNHSKKSGDGVQSEPRPVKFETPKINTTGLKIELEESATKEDQDLDDMLKRLDNSF